MSNSPNDTLNIIHPDDTLNLIHPDDIPSYSEKVVKDVRELLITALHAAGIPEGTDSEKINQLVVDIIKERRAILKARNIVLKEGNMMNISREEFIHAASVLSVVFDTKKILIKKLLPSHVNVHNIEFEKPSSSVPIIINGIAYFRYDVRKTSEDVQYTKFVSFDGENSEESYEVKTTKGHEFTTDEIIAAFYETA